MLLTPLHRPEHTRQRIVRELVIAIVPSSTSTKLQVHSKQSELSFDTRIVLVLKLQERRSTSLTQIELDDEGRCIEKVSGKNL